jgi:hypothetical protein
MSELTPGGGDLGQPFAILGGVSGARHHLALGGVAQAFVAGDHARTMRARFLLVCRKEKQGFCINLRS